MDNNPWSTLTSRLPIKRPSILLYLLPLHSGTLQQSRLFSLSARQQKSEETKNPAEPQALPHLTPNGEAHMVRVSDKPITLRRAIAIGHVSFSDSNTIKLIEKALIKKGDVLGTARLAGIMAAKNCPSLIPLCHPIVLSGVQVDVKLLEPTNKLLQGGVSVKSEVECVGQTGVEMEAFTSVTGALLTVIDMVKSVDRGARIETVRLVLKEGGRSGLWKDSNKA
ncbi:MoaC-domain-containing protein [Microthyrium microscopicum]|uniref:cyclic pyranopterin monophosphate synthase n=1 Tax=Microthyrium microscopicum TaxID=703497 RepID=A0A6A6UMH3_9PEZI|nr:MoaC-domain-containing protein [Microthyrium microscopicum]